MGPLMVVLDTCALLWWTVAPEQLSPKASEICGKIRDDGALVSSISIWELGIKQKKRKLDLGDSLAGYVKRLKSVAGIEIVPIDETIWIANIALDWRNQDPIDRTIVATAMLKELPILTKDQAIRDFYADSIW